MHGSSSHRRGAEDGFPSGRRFWTQPGRSAWISTRVCGGRGICGRCQVVQSTGEFAKHGVSSRVEHLSAFGPIERRYHEKRAPLAPGRRLGCSTTIQGDAVIDVPPDSQVHRQVVRKRAEVHEIRVDPVVRLRFVEVSPPDMHEPAGDLRRVEGGAERGVGPRELALRPRSARDPSDGTAGRRLAHHRCAPWRPRHRRGVARPAGPGVRGRGRHRLDHDCGAHLRSHVGARSLRRPAR